LETHVLTRRRPHGAGHIANSLADRARTSNAADRSQSMPAAMLGRWATRSSPCSCWTVGCSRAACELRGADVAATCHVTMTSPPESRPFASPSPSIPDPRTGHGGGPPSGRWRSAGHHDARVATLSFTRTGCCYGHLPEGSTAVHVLYCALSPSAVCMRI